MSIPNLCLSSKTSYETVYKCIVWLFLIYPKLITCMTFNPFTYLPTSSFSFHSTSVNENLWMGRSVQFGCSVVSDCSPMDYSMPDLPVHRQLSDLTQTHVHWVSDAIQPSHPLSFPSPPTFNLSQHQGLFQWVGSSHQVAKVLEFQLLRQSFQWIFRTDFL